MTLHVLVKLIRCRGNDLYQVFSNYSNHRSKNIQVVPKYRTLERGIPAHSTHSPIFLQAEFCEKFLAVRDTGRSAFRHQVAFSNLGRFGRFTRFERMLPGSKNYTFWNLEKGCFCPKVQALHTTAIFSNHLLLQVLAHIATTDKPLNRTARMRS